MQVAVSFRFNKVSTSVGFACPISTATGTEIFGFVIGWEDSFKVRPALCMIANTHFTIFTPKSCQGNE